MCVCVFFFFFLFFARFWVFMGLGVEGLGFRAFFGNYSPP